MRVIKSDTGYVAYQKIFRHIHTQSSRLVVWQVSPQTGEKHILNSVLNSYHFESGLLHFQSQDEFSFKDECPLFFYAEDGQFIFKSQLKEVRKGVFTVEVPKELKLLEAPDVIVIQGNTGINMSDVWKTKKLDVDVDTGPDLMIVKSMSQRTSRDKEFLDQEFDSVSLDEEEKLFADKRESPRARPKKGKLVKVKSELGPEEYMMSLFDLSQGGMGFITVNVEQFPKGSKILVLGFEEFNLDDPLIGKIMSHRLMDGSQIEFKIGVKFDEGQD
jgi:hypothetical protein